LILDFGCSISDLVFIGSKLKRIIIPLSNVHLPTN
jgi:hypothetical protein